MMAADKSNLGEKSKPTGSEKAAGKSKETNAGNKSGGGKDRETGGKHAKDSNRGEKGESRREGQADKQKAERDKQTKERDKRVKDTATKADKNRNVSTSERPGSHAAKVSKESKEAARSKGPEKKAATRSEKSASSPSPAASRAQSSPKSTLSKQQRDLQKIAKEGREAFEKNPTIPDGTTALVVSEMERPDGSRVTTVTQKDKTGAATQVSCFKDKDGKTRVDGVTIDKHGKATHFGHNEDKNGNESGHYHGERNNHVFSVEHKTLLPTSQPKVTSSRRPEKTPRTNPPIKNPGNAPAKSRPEKPEKRVYADHEIDPATLKALKTYEGKGLPNKPFQRYKDAVGVWTGGYGHTAQRGETLPEFMTEAEAEQFLIDDIRHVDREIDKKITVELSVSQRRALRTFLFNLGTGKLSNKIGLAAKINRKDFKGAAKQMLLYDKARHRSTNKLIALPGLTARRRKEAGEMLEQDDKRPKIPLKQN